MSLLNLLRRPPGRLCLHNARLSALAVRPLMSGRYRYGSSFSFTSNIPKPLSKRIAIGAGVVLTIGTGIVGWKIGTTYLDEPPPGPPPTPLLSLIRTYFVFTMCSIPSLVDSAPKLLSVLTSIPVIKQITEAFVRITFFDQFVGGDTAHDTLPVLHSLRAENKGTLFAYSVEVDEANATGQPSTKTSSVADLPPETGNIHKRMVNEMIRCIDVAADFEDELQAKNYANGIGNGLGLGGRRTWVAIKITALIPDAHALHNLSKHILTTRKPTAAAKAVPFPGCPQLTDLDILYAPETVQVSSPLTKSDIAQLADLHADLFRICARAEQRGVKIIVDAEYSWYQPALDALTFSLMRRFNKLPNSKDKTSTTSSTQPLIYATYQAYLRRTPEHLRQSIIDARTHNFSLGVKLVRGAYHPHEVAAQTAKALHKPTLSITPEDHPPVWTTKEETDACYDSCVKMLVGAVRDDLSARGRGKRTGGGKLVGLPTIGVLFGTHNWKSCDLILDELIRNGLAVRESVSEGETGSVVSIDDDVAESVTLGQLYGMGDDLADYVVAKTKSSAPLLIKYVPYGALSEVMPYLSRRAIENKSMLGEGGAVRERRRAGAEIRKRLFSWTSS